MKRIFLSVLVVIMTITISKADEGMWLLKDLNRQSVERMKELGFTFPIDKLYDENNPSLKDAVVIFGGGCTGVAVSEKGLIFTNHHCGYGAIQKLSAVEHDYLKDGFAAKAYNQELYADGLTVSFLRSMQDVTDQILPKVPGVLSEVQRHLFIDSLSNEIIESYEKDPFTRVRIIPFYTGNKYYMFFYDVFRDVRLVVAPPSSIGKFGGDTDNWMWPRHTGDFSVFRVYADANNKPANYSESNVPYKPKYVVPITLAGVKADDYAMTVGYPGSTERYKSSWGIRQRMESENKPRIEVRGVKQEIWWDAMTKSDAIRIKYANKYAGSSNYWKNSMGMNVALVKLGVIDRKEALEARLFDWIKGNKEREERFGNSINTLRDAYSQSDELARYTTYYLETFKNGIELIRFANTIINFDRDGTEEEKQNYINTRLLENYKDYEPQLDKKVLSALMKLYAERVPKEFLPDIYEKIDKEFGGSYERYADWLFANSKFTNLEDLLELLKTATLEDLTQDPAMQLAISTNEIGYDFTELMTPTYEKILRGERDFMAALMQMDSDKTFYPDATFTQRMSYGTVKGYKPNDAIWYNHFSTSDGILEKQKPGDPEFNVQPEILSKIRSGKFGRYATPEGKMVVAFLSNNDITGGNSGSPVFNGKAELIGLAFDGNWESLSGDILFEPEMQRTISVDIRYVLYVIEEIMDAKNVINELNIL